MEKKTEDLLRRPLYVYDLPQEVLNTLTLKESQEDGPESQTPKEDASRESSPDSPAGSKACSLCKFSFSDVQEQRSHQRSDLHRYNLKQKMRGRNPVSEAEFEKLIGDLDESLSGSDTTESEDDEDDLSKKDSTLVALLKKQATIAGQNNGKDGKDGKEDDGDSKRKQRGSGKPPLLWFSSAVLPANTYFGVYRAIFTNEEAKKEADLIDLIKKKQLAPMKAPNPGPDGIAIPATSNSSHFFLCMIGGGHFAAMVVSLAPRRSKHSAGPMDKEATVLAQKTFHRYTTRRKQGGSQSANDNAKGKANSAGSSIRRYNEQALTDEVRLLLQEWKGLLDTSELLFIRATGSTNRRTLFGPYEGQVLRANDPRIRGFPFNTRRAGERELKHAFIELTRLKVREIDPAESIKAQSEKPAKAATAKPAKPVKPSLSEEEETATMNTDQIQTLLKKKKVPNLLSWFKKNDLSPDFLFYPEDKHHHAPTPLHYSSTLGEPLVVSALLVKAGADPTIKNKASKTAYELAADRETRDEFRVARGEIGEDKWDWEAAKIPPALKREDVEKEHRRIKEEEANKEAERKKNAAAQVHVEEPKVDKKVKSSRLWAGMKKTEGQLLEELPSHRKNEVTRGLRSSFLDRLEKGGA